MKTPPFDKSLHGLSSWILWNTGYLLYVLCTALPILFYVFCLFLIAIKREASITLSIIMAVLINPLVSIPIGVTMKTIGQFFKAKIIPKQPTSTMARIGLRLLSYSLNCHLTMIGGLIYYLYFVWIDSEASSSVNFSNKPYNQCFCDVLDKLGFGQDCANWESENSFQNKLIAISLPLFLQAFLVTSLTCHSIHSLIIYIPSPLTLIDFIVELQQDNPKSLTSISRPASSKNKLKNYVYKWSKKINISKGSCCIIALFYMVAIASSPYYGFDLFLGSSSNENGRPYLLFSNLKL